MDLADAGAATLHISDIVKVALGLGLGTLALRWGGAELRQHITLPASVEGALDWLPVAALAAMISPLFAPSATGEINLPFLLAALISALIGMRTRNMLWGVGGGLVAFWCLQWLLR